MRLLIDTCDGHFSVSRVDTFERLKACILDDVINNPDGYNCPELIEKIRNCRTEEELLDCEIMDECNEIGLWNNRDMFATLRDPCPSKKLEKITKAIKEAEDQGLYEISEHLTSSIDLGDE